MQFTKEQLIKRLEEQESAALYALSFVQDIEILRDIEMDLRITEIALASLDAGSDSNSHPASGPLSNGRLHRIREILSKAAAQSDGGNLGYAMSDAVKAIDEALEVRKAEPVAYIRSAHNPDGFCFADGIHPTHRHQRLPLSTLQDGCYWKVTPLYAATPAPVVPEAKCDDDGNTTSEFDHGWNACRAAMLQGAEPVSNRDELPPDEIECDICGHISTDPEGRHYCCEDNSND